MPRNHDQPAPGTRGAPGPAALLAINGALLALLAAVTFGPSVDAQQGRRRGDYTMVAGGVKGAGSSAVYIVDTVNQEMMAVTYSQQTKTLDGIGYQNLAADASIVLRGRGN